MTSDLQRTGSIVVFARAARGLAFVTALTFCAVLLAFAAEGPAGAVLLGGLVTGAAIWPIQATLLAVAVVPVARHFAGAFTTYEGPAPLLLVAALGVGWFIGRSHPRRPAAAEPGWTAAIALGAVALVSLLIELAGIRTLVAPENFPDRAADAFAEVLRTTRIDHASMFAPVAASATMVLSLVAYWIGARQDGDAPLRVVRMFVVGAAAAGLLSILRLVEGALRAEHFWRALVEIPQVVRFGVSFTDVNAAGSYFSMALLAGIGLAAHEGGRVRALLGTAAAICGIGLWLSGSRSAVLAVLVAALAWVMRAGGPRARRTVAALGAAGVLALWLFPNPIVGTSAGGALAIRAELARASFRLLSTEPVFGVGIGRFYALSGDAIRDPAVRAIYTRENAHNNYLQILTELGPPGLLAFLWLLASIWPALRARSDPAWRGTGAGLLAFLVTCLAGHPLLIPEVALGFFAVLGATAAAGQPDDASRLSRTPVLVLAAVLALLAVSLPCRVRSEIRALDLTHVAHGVSEWRQDEQGRAFRVMTGRATFFVPASAVVVELPYRLVGEEPATLNIYVQERAADQLRVTDDVWRVYRVAMKERAGAARYVPLELEVASGIPGAVALGPIAVLQRER